MLAQGNALGPGGAPISFEPRRGEGRRPSHRPGTGARVAVSVDRVRVRNDAGGRGCRGVLPIPALGFSRGDAPGWNPSPLRGWMGWEVPPEPGASPRARMLRPFGADLGWGASRGNLGRCPCRGCASPGGGHYGALFLPGRCPGRGSFAPSGLDGVGGAP